MQKGVMAKWLKFQRSDPKTARRIRELVLDAAEVLHGKKPDDQVRALEREECKELAALLREHKNELAIQDHGYAYAAFILGLGYCTVLRAESRRD